MAAEALGVLGYGDSDVEALGDRIWNELTLDGKDLLEIAQGLIDDGRYL